MNHAGAGLHVRGDDQGARRCEATGLDEDAAAPGCDDLLLIGKGADGDGLVRLCNEVYCGELFSNDVVEEDLRGRAGVCGGRRSISKG